MRHSLALVFLITACTSLPWLVEKPPVERTSVEGTVRAWDLHRAEMIVRELEHYGPLVRGVLGVNDVPPPDVWFAREPLVNGVHGTVLSRTYRDGSIERLLVIAGASETVLEEVVPHELAHWYMLAAPWNELPQVMNEGVADFVTWSVNDALANFPSVFEGMNPEIARGLLALDDWTVEPEDRDRRTHDLRWAAMDVVMRLGIDGVRERAATWNTREVLIELGSFDPHLDRSGTGPVGSLPRCTIAKPSREGVRAPSALTAMRHTTFLPFLLMAYASACKSLPFEKPPIELKSVEGTVLAWDEERARMVASTLDRYARRVRICLGAPSPIDARAGPPPVVWFLREPYVDGSDGSVLDIAHPLGDTEYVIVIGSAHEGSLHEIVPHELAHWYMHDEGWDALPPVIEEGVADYVACKVNDDLDAFRERFPRPTIGAMEELAGMDYWTLDPRDRGRQAEAIRVAAIYLVIDCEMVGVLARVWSGDWNTREVMVQLGWLPE